MVRSELKIFQDLDREMNKTLDILRDAGIDTEFSPTPINEGLYKLFKKEKNARVSNKRYSNQYIANVKEQIIREKDILRNYKSCVNTPTYNTNWVNSRLGSVDMERFRQMLTGDFYDDATMNSMVCLAGSAFLAKSSSLSANDRIRSWIRNLKQIGTESMTGYALLGDAGSGITEESTGKGAFIVKAIKNAERGDELIHEVFCGMMALNRLRKMTPIYAYVYGFTECSAPIGGTATAKYPKGKEINTFCNTMGMGNDVVQALYENIAPAKDFGTLIKTCDGETYMQVYVATMMGLYIGEKECEFTHYDLHQENLLIRECTDNRYLAHKQAGGRSEIYIPFTLNLSDGTVVTYYVLSPSGIPTIIDYGRSHVNVDGRNYGMSGEDSYLYIKQNVYRDRMNPMYDAFKLLGMSLSHALSSGNVDLVGIMAPLLRRFHSSEFTVDGIIEYRDKSVGYMMPLSTTIEDMEQYIFYCIDYCTALGWNVVTENPPEGSFILTPVSDRLEVDVLRDVGLDDQLLAVPQPQTFLELYDVLTKQALLIEGYKGSIYDESGNYYPGLRQATIDDFEQRIKSSTALFRQVRKDFIKNVSIDGVTDGVAEDRQLDIAYDFALKRMKEVCDDFIDANSYTYDLLSQDIDNLEDIFPSIENVVTILNTPTKIDLYFDYKVLDQMRVYIGIIASFAEMRDTLSTLVHALEYIRKVYAKSGDDTTMLDGLYNYINTFLINIKPISQRYYDSLVNYINAFTEPQDGDTVLYNKYKDMAEEYRYEEFQWYFSTVITVPSLFRS